MFKTITFILILTISIYFKLNAQNTSLRDKYIKNPEKKEFSKRFGDVRDSLERKFYLSNKITLKGLGYNLYLLRDSTHWEGYLLENNNFEQPLTVDEWGNRYPNILSTVYEFNADSLHHFLAINNLYKMKHYSYKTISQFLTVK